jgi:lactate dehydrogenase-like 2-hydroxyacid dehydrogenase
MTQKEHILATFHFDEDILAIMEKEFIVHRLWEAEDNTAFMQGLSGTVRAVFTSAMIKIDPAFMDALPKLEIICGFGAGYERIDVAAASARGIKVTNVQAANSGCVADFAMGLLISAARGMMPAARFVRAGKWPARLGGADPQLYPITPRFYGRKLGILGMGQIGLAVARRAAAFDMDVGYHNRKPRADVNHSYFGSPLELAEWCDYLVIAAPGGESTKHLVNGAVLDALGPSGVVVNVGRGSIIDQQALIDRLSDGRLHAAGLDVIDGEPAVPAKLLELENAVITPHCAGVTRESSEASMDTVLRNIRAQFAGQPLLTQVN